MDIAECSYFAFITDFPRQMRRHPRSSVDGLTSPGWCRGYDRAVCPHLRPEIAGRSIHSSVALHLSSGRAGKLRRQPDVVLRPVRRPRGNPRKKSPPPSAPRHQRELAVPRLIESDRPFPAMFPTGDTGKPRWRSGHDRLPRPPGMANVWHGQKGSPRASPPHPE